MYVEYIFLGDLQIFIEDLYIFIGYPQDFHWRPPRFSLETLQIHIGDLQDFETQNFCFNPPIFIGLETLRFSLKTQNIFNKDPNISSETPIFSFGILYFLF